MFTLMPVAAFAANDAYVTVNDEEKDTVEVNEEVALDVVDGEGSYLFFAVDEDGVLDQVVATGSAISFDEVGSYDVYAAAASDVTSINGQVITKAAKLELLMELDSLVEDYAVVKVKASDVDYRIVLADNNDVTNVRFATVTEGEEYSTRIDANDGWSEDGAIMATLQKSTDNKVTWTDVKGAELTFTKAGYVDVIVEDATTDRGGDVEFEVVSDRAGEYTMYVKYGTEAKVKLNVAVVSSDVAGVEVETVPAAPVNIANAIERANVEFKFVDASGVAYAAADTLASPTDYKITVVSQPADSDMEGADFALTQQAEDLRAGVDADPTGVLTLTGGDSTYFEEEGEYVIKVTLANGDSATATVKVAEMGDIVAIKFNKAPVTVAYDAIDANVIGRGVIAIDAKGVAGAPEDAVVYSVSGKAVASFDGSKVTMKADEDYIGSTITVYAVSGDFTVSNTLTVVDNAAMIKYTNTTAEVGVNNVLYGYVLDSNGKNVTITPKADGIKAIVLDAPENAVVVAKADTYTAKKGVELNLLASVAGEYKIQTIIITDDNKYISSIETFTVGATEGTFKDVVVLSIGADKLVKNSEVKDIPAAAVIKDSRTFVPFRALAQAFGAEVDWVEATQSVVAELNGVKVVMTIGSADYTVNGVAAKADVAPYLNAEAGTTMVPVSFVAKAFGINYQCIYAADGTVADVLFTK